VEAWQKIMKKAFEWISQKWKLVVGFLVASFGLLSLVLRNRNSKAVLKNAKESHKKELRINEESSEALEEGLKEIHDKSVEEIEKVIDKTHSDKKAIEKEKEDFVKSSSDTKKLASDIAEHIGADFVERKK
jgi:hypothetical protein